MNEEKDVQHPQKPVVRPIYIGMDFLTALCFLVCSCALCSSLGGVGGEPHSSRKMFESSTRKPITRLPVTFAQRTPVTTGAPV